MFILYKLYILSSNPTPSEKQCCILLVLNFLHKNPHLICFFNGQKVSHSHTHDYFIKYISHIKCISKLTCILIHQHFTVARTGYFRYIVIYKASAVGASHLVCTVSSYRNRFMSFNNGSRERKQLKWCFVLPKYTSLKMIRHRSCHGSDVTGAGVPNIWLKKSIQIPDSLFKLHSKPREEGAAGLIRRNHVCKLD